MKRFYLFYNQEDTIRQQAVDELQNILFRIPWDTIYIFLQNVQIRHKQFFTFRKHLPIIGAGRFC